MARAECSELLMWALPQVGLRFEGYKKVQRQVCRRLDEQRQALGLSSTAAYRDYLEAHPDEWASFRRLARVTVSRFYRDTELWDGLRAILPELGTSIRAWSAGCASGEEVWTLRLIARLDDTAPDIAVVATDIEDEMLFRAQAARYEAGTLRWLPEGWRDQAFHRSADALRLHNDWRDGVEFLQQDLMETTPDGPFAVILCRNLAFTYFDDVNQAMVAERIQSRLQEGGVLMLGKGERLPDEAGWERLHDSGALLRKR